MSARQPKSGSAAKRVRSRPPRRKPVDPEAGINTDAERAFVAAEIGRLMPRIEALVPEALDKQATHVMYVLDPDNTLFTVDTGRPNPLGAMRAGMKGGTGVALVPADTVARLVQMIADVFPHFAELVEQIRTAPPPGFVRMFIQIRHSLALHLLPLAHGAVKEEAALN